MGEAKRPDDRYCSVIQSRDIGICVISLRCDSKTSKPRVLCSPPSSLYAKLWRLHRPQRFGRREAKPIIKTIPGSIVVVKQPAARDELPLFASK